MGKPFLSRHFLSERASCLEPLPFAPAGAEDDAGVAVTHNLLAAGCWSEDAQEYRLTVLDLAVGYRGAEVAGTPSVTALASFAHSGAVCAVSAADLGGGSVVLVAASAEGTLSRLRMQVPTAPGSLPEGIQLAGEDFEEAALVPWLDAHAAAAAAVDVSAESRQVLSAGADGSLAVHPLDAEAAAGAPFYSCGGAAAFTAARWTSPATFVTASLQGVLQAWDTRQRGAPALLCAPPATSPAARRAPLLSLAAHPAHPHACATGDADGTVAVWDLRTAAQAARHEVGGAVGGLCYDASGGGAQLAFCTSRGAVGVAGEGGVRVMFTEPGAAVEAVCTSAAGAVGQLCCATEMEGLVFAAHVL